jgi:putative aminopeptidase FrvX
MNSEQLSRFKLLLSVPSKTYEETQMVEYISEILEGMSDVTFYRDEVNNIYATKGTLEDGEYYPMFIAHTDTVHQMVEEIVVKEERAIKPHTYGKTFDGTVHDILKAYTPEGLPTGIGGDDKAGVFIALELLRTLPKVKVGLFVSEETGCHGSQRCDVNFLNDVGYAVQFDAPGDHLITRICWGVKLYDDDGEFIKIAKSTFETWMDTVASEQTHPYTDVSQIKQKGDFSCINFSCGYYNMHSSQEFVVIKDVENAIWMAEDLVNKLGYKKYKYKYVPYKYDWKAYGYYGSVDDVEFEDVEDDYNEPGTEVGDNLLTFDSIGLTIKDKFTDEVLFFEGDDIYELYKVLKEHLDL